MHEMGCCYGMLITLDWNNRQLVRMSATDDNRIGCKVLVTTRSKYIEDSWDWNARSEMPEGQNIMNGGES